MGNVLSNTQNRQRVAIEQANKERLLSIEAARSLTKDLSKSLRDEILSLTLFELIAALQTSKYTAELTLKAYISKALEVQEKLNCICEFLPEAIERARALDMDYSSRSDKPPLFGVPFSVKSNLHLAGHDSAAGLPSKINEKCVEDCTLITQLMELGAVPFVITNVPQTLLSFTCSNPIYGTTLNPHNISRTPGGSSGGEACLLAAGGTPFATGNDIGGSLRIPAAFCGVVSLKPTQDRLIVENINPGLPGRCRLGLGHGFFTKTVAEQCLLSSLVYGTEAYRRLIVRHTASIPFREEIVSAFSAPEKRIRIGFFSDDGFIPATPGYVRVVNATVNKLRECGHEMVPFQVPNPNEGAYCLFRELFPDGGAFMLDLFEKNIVDENMKSISLLLKTPIWVRYFASLFFRHSSPQLYVVARSYMKTAEDVRKANAELDEYNKQFLNAWTNLNLDALICPGFCVPAVEHDKPSKIISCAFSTGLYNMLDYPAGIVPVDRVTDEDDISLMDQTKYPTDGNMLLTMVRDAAKNSIGLPLSVQVVTKPFEEEKCLAVMKLVEKVWK